MRGHLAIRELRRMGKKPSQAWIFLLSDGQKPNGFIDPEDLMHSGCMPEIYVDADEKIEALDLRFLVGVTVHLQGQDKDRLRAAHAQLRRCRPARIITSGADVLHDTGAKNE